MSLIRTVAHATIGNTISYGANTGDGTITGVLAPLRTVTQTWTLTCTAATLDSGTFSVVGDIDGAQADATVATAYDNGLIAFTINDGATDWVVGDTITISITREFYEPKVNGSVNTVQVVIEGTITNCVFDVTSSLDDITFIPTTTITTATNSLTAATAVNTFSNKINFTTVDVPEYALIKVYTV